jgi:hypothetical protein
MDLSDLRDSIDCGDSFAEVAIFLCRDEHEVRAKAKELGLIEHPGKRASLRLVRNE